MIVPHGVLLLENLFFNCCKKHKVNSLVTHNVYSNRVLK